VKVLVVAARRYNGHELWTSLGVLQLRGHEFEVVSTSKVIMDEVTFVKNRIDKTIDDVPDLAGFDALMFISGNMQDTEMYWKDKRTLKYVHEAVERNLPIAAICCSVPTIREAAKDKRVSFFPLIRSRDLLIRAGAIPQTVAFTVDGNLVTAEHQMATQMWTEEFCNVLEGKPPELSLRDSGFVPKGNERKPMPELEYLKDVVRNSGRTNVSSKRDIP
jgi:putative intracellular protease/amidase